MITIWYTDVQSLCHFRFLSFFSLKEQFVTFIPYLSSRWNANNNKTLINLRTVCIFHQSSFCEKAQAVFHWGWSFFLGLKKISNQRPEMEIQVWCTVSGSISNCAQHLLSYARIFTDLETTSNIRCHALKNGSIKRFDSCSKIYHHIRYCFIVFRTNKRWPRGQSLTFSSLEQNKNGHIYNKAQGKSLLCVSQLFRKFGETY